MGDVYYLLASDNMISLAPSLVVFILMVLLFIYAELKEDVIYYWLCGIVTMPFGIWLLGTANNNMLNVAFLGGLACLLLGLYTIVRGMMMVFKNLKSRKEKKTKG